ncbi:hypothetical protein AAMO2058_000715500 [Amorphochlora amoebiformis]
MSSTPPPIPKTAPPSHPKVSPPPVPTKRTPELPTPPRRKPKIPPRRSTESKLASISPPVRHPPIPTQRARQDTQLSVQTFATFSTAGDRPANSTLGSISTQCWEDAGKVPQISEESQSLDFRWVFEALEEFKKTHVKDRRHLFRTHKRCFIASELVDYLVNFDKKPMEITREQAVSLARLEVQKGTFMHVSGDSPSFEDKNAFFTFSSTTSPPLERARKSSTITQHGSLLLSEKSSEAEINQIDGEEGEKIGAEIKRPVPKRDRRVRTGGIRLIGGSLRASSAHQDVLLKAKELKASILAEEKNDSPDSPIGDKIYDAEILSPDKSIDHSMTNFTWNDNELDESPNADDFDYESMIHQFPEVEKQTRAGLFVMIRLSKFIKKQSDILKATCTEWRRVHTYEMQKTSEWRQDNMAEHLEAFEGLYSAEFEMGKLFEKFKTSAVTFVVDPAANYVESSLKTMDELTRAQKSKSAGLEAAANQLQENRKSCLKKYKELKTLHDKIVSLKSKPGKEKETNKYEGKKKKAQEVAYKQFAKTEKLEREYSDEMRLYRHSWLPEALKQMKGIEFERLTLQKKLLEWYGNLRLDLLSALTGEFKAFQKRNIALDAQRDINKCCSKWQGEFGFAPPINSRQSLPCSSDELKTDDWIHKMERKASMESRVTLKPTKKFGQRKMAIINTPIDKTTTYEAEGEKWHRAIAEHIPRRDTDLRLDVDDIVHLVTQEPESGGKVLRVAGMPLKQGDSVSMINDWQLNSSKKSWLNLGIESSHKTSPKSRSGNVVRIWEKDSKKGYEKDIQGLEVAAGDEITLLKRVGPADDFVHCRRADGKEGVVPIMLIKPSLYKPATKSGNEEDTKPLISPEPDDSKACVIRSPAASSVRTVVSIKMWEGVNIRNISRGSFPAHNVVSVNESAKNIKVKRSRSRQDVGDDGDDDDDEDEGHATKIAGSFSVMTDMIKSKVSKKKRRFIKDGFNLDLSYITPQIIAMGFPSSGMEAKYRNNIIDVQRFFGERHKSEYWIWNLCIEKGRDYDAKKFENAVTRLGFHDHNPCPFNMIEPFCRDVHNFLTRKKGHVAAIHCKAGKGRTGFLISCYLIYANPEWFNADRALRFFAVKRTKNQKGVTIPSQRRYVGYFDRFLRDRDEKKKASMKSFRRSLDTLPSIPFSRSVKLMRVSILPIPHMVKTDNVHFTVWTPTPSCNDDKKNIWKSKGNVKCQRRPAQDYLLFTGGNKGIHRFSDDAKFTFTYDAGFMSKTQKLFHFWLNARFLHPIMGKPGYYEYTLYKAELDKACKDKKHELFADNFRVEMEFFTEDL